MTTKEKQMDEQEVRRLNAEVPHCIGSKDVSKALGVQPSNLGAVAGLPECVPWSKDSPRGQLWRVDVIEAFATERAKRYTSEHPGRGYHKGKVPV